MRTVITFAIATFFSNSLIASCAMSSIPENYNKADVVFTGHIIEKYDTCNLGLGITSTRDPVENNQQRSLPNRRDACSGGDTVSLVRVEEVFKDTWSRLKESKDSSGVIVYAHSSTAGTYIMKDRDYLLFAANPTYSMFLVGLCTGSGLVENAADEIMQLREIKQALYGGKDP